MAKSHEVLQIKAEKFAAKLRSKRQYEKKLLQFLGKVRWGDNWEMTLALINTFAKETFQLRGEKIIHLLGWAMVYFLLQNVFPWIFHRSYLGQIIIITQVKLFNSYLVQATF